MYPRVPVWFAGGMMVCLLLVVYVSLSTAAVALPHRDTEREDAARIDVPRVIRGRYSHSRDGGIHFDWPGVVLEMAIQCDDAEAAIDFSLSFSLPFGSRWGDDMSRQESGGGHRFAVHVDRVRQPYEFTPTGYEEARESTHSLLLRGLTPNQWHVVRLTLQTEAFAGAVNVHTMRSARCRMRKEPRVRSKERWLFIGDSLTTGYGVLGGPKAVCPFTMPSESFLDGTIGQFIDMFAGADPEYEVVAWSGRGLRRNYNSNFGPNMTKLWRRTIANDERLWDPRRFQALDVIVWLGANDLSTEPRPSLDSFNRSYNALLDDILRLYPSVRSITCLCGPWDYYCKGDYVRLSVTHRIAPRSIISYLSLMGDITDLYPGPYTGCHGHPNKAAAAGLAAKLHDYVMRRRQQVEGSGEH